MRKKIFILAIIFNFASYSIAQKASPQKVFHFQVLNRQLDSLNSIPFGTEFEFEVTRRMISDSVFWEKNLFGDSSLFKFRKSNGVWFIWQNRWSIFFNKSVLYNNLILRINNLNYRIVFGKKIQFNKVDVYELRLIPVGFSVSHIPIYLFNEERGIVGLKTGTVTLIRTPF